jgi:hypothetical protein
LMPAFFVGCSASLSIPLPLSSSIPLHKSKKKTQPKTSPTNYQFGLQPPHPPKKICFLFRFALILCLSEIQPSNLLPCLARGKHDLQRKRRKTNVNSLSLSLFLSLSLTQTHNRVRSPNLAKKVSYIKGVKSHYLE